jgi:hypothetical protein
MEHGNGAITGRDDNHGDPQTNFLPPRRAAAIIISVNIYVIGFGVRHQPHGVDVGDNRSLSGGGISPHAGSELGSFSPPGKEEVLAVWGLMTRSVGEMNYAHSRPSAADRRGPDRADQQTKKELSICFMLPS